MAGAVAAPAAPGLVGVEVGADAKAGRGQRSLGDHRALLAVRAELAGEALGDDAVDRGGGEKALDPDLRQTGDRR